MTWKRATAALTVAAAALATAGCGDEAADTDGRTIVTSFYPLQYVTERIAGERAEVIDLTPPGAEPHDLELGPKDVAAVADADLVVHLSGFQPSVDEAVAGQAVGRDLDVAPAARLDLAPPAGGDEDEDGGTRDPHFWLDPERFVAVAEAIRARLTEDDPAGADAYRQGFEALRTDLRALDAEFRTGLAGCTSRDLVTAHAAFGYLARRYGLTQRPIAGLSPDAEPTAAALAAVTDEVRTRGIRTIYTETLASPAIARTVAAETGARTAVLDPVEGITDASAGEDYLAVMRANLASLREGQPCP